MSDSLIAVTGATGHLGGLVIERLLESRPAASLVAAVRDRKKAERLAAKGVQVRVARYQDRAGLESALTGVGTLLLVSGSEVGQRVPQHVNVIDAARTVGVGRVVYTSAPKATTSELVVAAEHKATEEYLTASGLDYTILRNGWYTENYLPQFATARQTGTIIAAVGDGRVASASRTDYADAAAAVLTGEGHSRTVYELSGDHAWDYNELAATIGQIIDRPVRYQRVDGPTLVTILTSAGMPEEVAQSIAALDANIADGLLAGTTGELSTILGRPTTTLKDGLLASLT
ncbi:SDR family oxidoreductase [Microbacterium aurum]